MEKENLAKRCIKTLPIKILLCGIFCVLLSFIIIKIFHDDTNEFSTSIIDVLTIGIFSIFFIVYSICTFKEFKFIKELLNNSNDNIFQCYEQNSSDLFVPLKSRPNRVVDYFIGGKQIYSFYIPLFSILYLTLVIMVVIVGGLLAKNFLPTSIFIVISFVVYCFLGLTVNQILFIKNVGYRKKSSAYMPLILQLKAFLAIPIIIFFQMTLAKKGYYFKNDTKEFIPLDNITALQILSVKEKIFTHYQLNLILNDNTRICLMSNDFLYHIVKFATKISEYFTIPIVTTNEQLQDILKK